MIINAFLRKHRIIAIFLFASIIHLCSPAPSLASGLSKISNVLIRFEKAWENKDLTALSACFLNLPAEQKEMYTSLFTIIDTVDITIDIKRVFTNRLFGGAVTTLKKNIVFSSPELKNTPLVEQENINYLFTKKGDQWFIAGTVKPDLANAPIKVTEQNMEYINKKIASSSNTILSNRPAYNDVIDIPSATRRITVPSGTGYQTVKIILTTKASNTQSGYKVLWTKQGIPLSYVEIPQQVFSIMTKNVIYFLRMENYIDESHLASSAIFKIRRK